MDAADQCSKAFVVCGAIDAATTVEVVMHRAAKLLAVVERWEVVIAVPRSVAHRAGATSKILAVVDAIAVAVVMPSSMTAAAKSSTKVSTSEGYRRQRVKESLRSIRQTVRSNQSVHERSLIQGRALRLVTDARLATNAARVMQKMLHVPIT